MDCDTSLAYFKGYHRNSIRHEAEYASVLRASGVTDVQRHDSHFTSPFFAIITLGIVRPFVLVGRKPSASL